MKGKRQHNPARLLPQFETPVVATIDETNLRPTPGRGGRLLAGKEVSSPCLDEASKRNAC
jgi:hypothetical protein